MLSISSREHSKLISYKLFSLSLLTLVCLYSTCSVPNFFSFCHFSSLLQRHVSASSFGSKLIFYNFVQCAPDQLSFVLESMRARKRDVIDTENYIGLLNTKKKCKARYRSSRISLKTIRPGKDSTRYQQRKQKSQ